jgi:hypothetical protein
METFRWAFSKQIPGTFGNASNVFGGFQLEFVSITWVVNHMTCYKLSALIGGNYTQM